MAVHAQPGRCPGTRPCATTSRSRLEVERKPGRVSRFAEPSRNTRPRVRVLRGVLLALLCAALSPAAGAAQMPRISAHGSRLYAGARPWRAWGMNWGVGDHAPVIAYFDDPTAAHLSVLRAELQTAKEMGANSMRIYLQLGQVMATPTQPRQQSLTALRRLLALAQSQDIYLDITGDLVWQPSLAPAWYGALGWKARWHVQAQFWKAVAHAAATSPAVLCYELTSEPTVAHTPGYYYGQIGHWWFVQSIATDQARHADTLARAWTRLLGQAVRSQDDRPVGIGLLPSTTGPFAPANIADLLDILIVHEYPTTGHAPAAVSLIRSFAASHKPVLIGETFMLSDDAPTQEEFLTGASRYLTGAFEFFDGRDPTTIHVQSISDAVYQVGLEQFVALRHALLHD
jgi:hypothetical protein